jgi:hypothetical protein
MNWQSISNNQKNVGGQLLRQSREYPATNHDKITAMAMKLATTVFGLMASTGFPQ